MAECKETRKLCRALEFQGAITFPAVAGEYSPPGWPDRWMAHGDWSAWIEFKAYNGRVKPEQVTQMNRIRAAGGRAYVVRFSEDWTLFCVESPEGVALSDWWSWGKFLEVVKCLE